MDRMPADPAGGSAPGMKQELAAWTQALREGAVAGTAGSLLSTLALLALGRRQAGSAVAPLNAVSHWLWADRAFRQSDQLGIHGRGSCVVGVGWAVSAVRR